MKRNILTLVTAIGFAVLASNVYAGGTGVGNPGTSTVVKPVPPGTVRAPHQQHEVDLKLS